LRPADIDKIITSYKTRTNQDKYSHVAPLSEIAENDYNLNIPRYVDTFEEEEAVDLKTVSEALQNLEKEMKSTDDLIAGYCRELGIDTPF
jgi:type I restriction enzyme M protein